MRLLWMTITIAALACSRDNARDDKPARALGLLGAAKPAADSADLWIKSRPKTNVRFDVAEPRRFAASARDWTPIDTRKQGAKLPPYRCAQAIPGIAAKASAARDTMYVLVLDNRARDYGSSYCAPWGVAAVTVDTAGRALVTYPPAERGCDPWPVSVKRELACTTIAARTPNAKGP